MKTIKEQYSDWKENKVKVHIEWKRDNSTFFYNGFILDFDDSQILFLDDKLPEPFLIPRNNMVSVSQHNSEGGVDED